MKMRSNLDWNAIVAVCLLAGTSVSARVCVLSTEPDGDRVKFVLPPGDPCSCTQVMLGGHNAYALPRKDQPVYIDTLPMDAKGLRRSQGCPDESTQSVSREQTSTSQDETTESPVTSEAQIMYEDCQDALDKGITTSGVYTIDPYRTEPFKAYCDMTNNPGKGYIVIQRRYNGSVNFSRNWTEYEQGFGDLHGEFWLGNDKIHKITTSFDVHDWELLVTLTAFDGLFAQARYDKFSIKAESDRYEIDVNFDAVNLNDAGNAFDSKMFSTFDRDNDDDETKNCAKLQNGGWWLGNVTTRRVI